MVAEFYASEADLGGEHVDTLLLRSRLPSSAVAASIWSKWNRQIQLGPCETVQELQCAHEESKNQRRKKAYQKCAHEPWRVFPLRSPFSLLCWAAEEESGGHGVGGTRGGGRAGDALHGAMRRSSKEAAAEGKAGGGSAACRLGGRHEGLM